MSNTQSTVSTVSEVTDESSKKARRVVSSASVKADFESLLSFIDAQVEQLRATATKGSNTGVKAFRSISSRVKQLHKDTARVMDTPRKRPRAVTATNGGFLKCHPVTTAMAEFAGWSPDEMKSRVDITKAICQYVKDNKLYDPSQKKNILPDSKLKQLLNYDPEVAGNPPLTYYHLQTFIKSLQVKSA